MLQPSYILPEWPAPSNIKAFTSCRNGGFSAAPYGSFNMAKHVGDDPQKVEKNRQLLPGYQHFVWLKQVHSNSCLDLDEAAPLENEKVEADACFSAKPNQVCAVMTADCLPILLCDKTGTCVAAVHAGWRGLATGVIENTLSKMHITHANIIAWMGPAISQRYFEVGQEVKDIFHSFPDAFIANEHAEEIKFFADIYSIARQKLLQSGVTAVYGGEYCTYGQNELFFSHRRATHSSVNTQLAPATTGRMVSAIYLNA